jgi:hypothetical protein
VLDQPSADPAENSTRKNHRMPHSIAGAVGSLVTSFPLGRLEPQRDVILLEKVSRRRADDIRRARGADLRKMVIALALLPLSTKYSWVVTRRNVRRLAGTQRRQPSRMIS